MSLPLQNTKFSKSEIFYVFLLVAFSGNPFFNLGNEVVQIIFLLIVFILSLRFNRYFLLKTERLKTYYVIFFGFVLIFILQFLNLGFISIQSVIALLLKITFGFIIINRIKENFKFIYLNIIYFISIFSLIGFSYNLLGYNIPNYLGAISTEKVNSIFIYTQNFGDDSQGIRNSGMFWEPGAFAGYICLAFLLHIGQIFDLVRQHFLKVITISTALLTSFNTTMSIVCFFILLITLINEFSFNYRWLISIPLLSIIIFLSLNIFQNFSFLGEKIESQLSTTYDLNGEFSNTRFGSMYFDFHYIQKNPLTGNGFHQETRYADHPWLQNSNLGHGNGFSNFIASVGILGFILLIYPIASFRNRYKWYFLIGIIFLLQSEQYLNFPLFLALPFIFRNEKNSNITYLS